MELPEARQRAIRDVVDIALVVNYVSLICDAYGFSTCSVCWIFYVLSIKVGHIVLVPDYLCSCFWSNINGAIFFFRFWVCVLLFACCYHS